MNSERKKSGTMKLSVKSTPYFPAYSLKALDSSSTATKTRNKQFSRVINRLRASPTDNSYLKTTSINKINIPAAVQPGDKNWFISYEWETLSNKNEKISSYGRFFYAFYGLKLKYLWSGQLLQVAVCASWIINKIQFY